MRSFLRSLIRLLIRILFALAMTLEIEGRENVPAQGPLIVIGNHFSIFEAPILLLVLPYGDRMTYLAATEVQESRLFRYLYDLFNMIPIWRGQPDRRALRGALDWLAGGGVLGIMPEGSVDPELLERIESGQQTGLHGGASSRGSAQLLPARPGAAYLAVRSGAPVLPAAFLGTERVMENLRRGRRTRVRLAIGPLFGPLTVEAGLGSKERRERIDELGHEMMRRLAALLPPENRGPYA